MNQISPNKQPNTDSTRYTVFDKNFFRILFIVIVPSLLVIGSMPYILTKAFGLQFANDGEVGNAIGGTTAPFIGTLGAILTFLAFWVQFKANEQQKADIAQQAKEIEHQKRHSNIERFEARFYNAIALHRNNVNEFQLRSDTVGPRAFMSLFNELRFIHSLVYHEYHSVYKKFVNGPQISDDVLYNIAYFFFFFGTDANRESTLMNPFPDKYKPFVQHIEGLIRGQQDIWLRDNNGMSMRYADTTGHTHTGLDTASAPGLGHSVVLSHYFRHLFHLVKSVHEVDRSLLSYEDKYRYVSILRAQLSSYEQLLIYYNALSVMGAPWLGEGGTSVNYMKEYCVVRGLPLPLANFYKNPLHVLGHQNDHQKSMFDWIDINYRLAILS